MRYWLTGPALGLLLLIGCGGGGGGGGISGPPATATLSGIVMEEGTSTPLAGATVSLGSSSTISGANGQFQLQNVPVGPGLSLTVSAPGFAAVTQSVDVRAGANSFNVFLVRNGLYELSDYLVYLPPQVTTYRGVFVVMFGGTVDTRPLLRGDLSYYQAFPLAGDVAGYRQRLLDFARNHGFAVVGAAFGAQGRGPEAYASLMNVVNTAGSLAGHGELASVPFILHGHSATACFAYEFAVAHPNRTIGFIAAKSSCTADPGAAIAVPGYFFFGGNDPQVPVSVSAQMRLHVEQNRAHGALWAFAIEPGAGHAQVANQNLLFRWIATVATLRLPAAGSALQPLSEAAGWLGDHTTFAIAPYPSFTGSANTASWLPTMETAQDWKALVQAGSVSSRFVSQ
jgi:hypothetical protein